MWYSTDFQWQLDIHKNAQHEELNELESFMWADMREHDEWDSWYLTWVDLELHREDLVITWDGSEKTYDLVEKINFIIQHMLKKYPFFELTWTMYANWEEHDDVWMIVMENNVAVREEMVTVWTKITCPHCEKKFKINLD